MGCRVGWPVGFVPLAVGTAEGIWVGFGVGRLSFVGYGEGRIEGSGVGSAVG